MAPWNCPECGVWWAGLEHRCRPAEVGTGTDPFKPYIPAPPYIPPASGGTYTLTCSCGLKGMSVPETVFCLIHDVQVTLTHPLSGGTI
jgi:hypothetical protein